MIRCPHHGEISLSLMPIDIDDLYNNLRVYEDELKRSSGSNSASQNLAFLSSKNTSSTNEVSTASGDFGVSTPGGINQVPSTPCAHDIAYSFLAQPTTSPQLENEDFQQMDGDDLEELDLRWQVAMLTVRVKKFIQRTGRNMDFKEKRHVSLDKSKIECYNCHRKGHFARECRSGRSQGRRSYGDNGRNNVPTNESSSQELVAQDGLGGYDWSNDFEVEPVNYALMAISSSSSSSSSDNETAGKINDANTEKPKSVVSNPKINRDSVIIEDWTSDDEEEVSEVQKVRPETRDDKDFVSTARPTSVSTVRPVSTARPSINTARPVSTASPNTSTARPGYASRPIHRRMDNVRPRGSCSPIKRSYYTKSAFRPKDLKQDVKTFGVKNMTTAGKRAVVNTVRLKKWWIVVDHAVVDSGCSSHMTGNKAYLSDYEDFNGGFVAFGSDPKGVNLFFVSQMGDKIKGSFFTESECLILSPSFKLLDESQVVLRAPRKDDVYNLDLKNIVPSGDVLQNDAKDEASSWDNGIEVQRHLRLRIEAHGKYMQTILEKRVKT
ncbi:ribonuclease H-like domain-containing protein [Tanacetum coccineum]|uniref:Ribonuclease H-like domain-containing protein n=1 Tax=Tanacetum coccineum TaxID=301880 RepID=A0ABQ5B5P9_9ASTR